MNRGWGATLSLAILSLAMPANAETAMRAWTSIEYVASDRDVNPAQHEVNWYKGGGLTVRDLRDGTSTLTTDDYADPTRLDVPLNYNGPNSAAAYVDLATGKLGVSAFAKGSGGATRYDTGNGYAEGIASLQEDLTFKAVGATSDDLTVIDYEAIVHGVFSGTGAWSAYGGLGYGPDGTRFDKTEQIAPDTWRLTGQASFRGASWTRDFDFQLMAYARADGPGDQSAGSADMMNTATIRFNLPSNVTMTSASGTFLSAASNSAVPEPGTWVTMLLGFGVIGVALRRQTVLRFV